MNAIRILVASTAAILVVASVPAQAPTKVPPQLYLHFGIGQGHTAQRLLTTRIVLADPVTVAGADHWQLTGWVKRDRMGFTVELFGSTGPQSGSYRGAAALERPLFSQGGASSGGATAMWFAVSTNFDSKPLIEHIKNFNNVSK